MNIRVFVISLTLTAVAASVSPVFAYTYQQVFSFCDQFERCTVGKNPSGGVIEDAAGNLYGTDGVGGGNGTVYELSATGKHGALKYKNLHSFCEHSPDCTKEGNGPEGFLVRDTSGNFFGLTYYGGTKVGGTLYEISPNDDFTKYSYRTLYNFCDGDACTGSAGLNSSLAYEASGNNQPYDGVSPLYTTGQIGAPNGHLDCGKVFQLLPDPGHKFWQRRIIHDFGDETTDDGCVPQGRLIFDSKGDIFGTTQSAAGDINGVGIVYELTPNAKRTKWTERILHVFCPGHDGGPGACPDGAQPNGVTFDNSGRLVGTTFAGGTGAGNAGCDLYEGGGNCGVVFRLGRSGGAWHYSVLYNFCSLADCADGHASLSIPTVDAGNNLIGTVSLSPATGGPGAIFELTSGGTESLLHVFCPDGVCGGDGSGASDLFLDASGNLFGAAGQGGGPGHGGTVFELTP